MIWLLPFISAFIGWITNWVAIKMLFHPKVEKNFLGLKVQGIFPKRQKQFAQKLGILVANELISFEAIAGKINSPATIQKALPTIEAHVQQFIDKKLKEEIPLLSMFIPDKTIAKLQGNIVEEVEVLLPVLINNMLSGLQSDLNIERMVVEKVEAFSSDKLESILMDIMKREFRFVELIGAVLGFLIGLIQVLLTTLV